MGRKLPDYVREGRKHIAGWDKVLGPIAQRHPCSENEPIKQYSFEKGTRVTYENLPLNDFKLDFSYHTGYGFDFPCGKIRYAREVAPYDDKTEHHLNMRACCDLLPIIQDASMVLGLNAAIDANGNIAAMHPGITFGGEFDIEQFHEVSRLLEMTESMIDFKLERIDATMERPFHYAFVPSGIKVGSRDCCYFRKINSLSDLEGAEKVFLSRRELTKEPITPKDSMLYGEHILAEIARENHGRWLSVDDFVKSA